MTTETYPLAFDVDGNPMSLPPEAKAWRVRRGGGRRGRPRSVFDPETGKQLDVPLGATIDDLIDRGCVPDRYRLEPVDEAGRILPGFVAVCEVAKLDTDGEDAAVPPAEGDTVGKLTVLVERCIDANVRTLEALASAFGTVRPLPPAPIVVEQPAAAPVTEAPGGSMKPEQIMQMVMQAIPMLAQAWKNGVAQAATGGAP